MTIWEQTIEKLGEDKGTLAREARKLIGKLQRDMEVLTDDPMTAAYGAPVDDIFFDRRKKHIAACDRMHKQLMSAGLTELARELSDEMFQWMED